MITPALPRTPRTPRTPRPQEAQLPGPGPTRPGAPLAGRTRASLPARPPARPAMAPLGYFFLLCALEQALGSYPIWW